MNELQNNEVKVFMCDASKKIKCTKGKGFAKKINKKQANISYLKPAHVLQVKYQTKCKSCFKVKHQFNKVFLFLW